MKKDVISKEILKNTIKELALLLFNLKIKNVEIIDSEFERVEKKQADIVALVDKSYMLHIEIQSFYDKKMPLRMLRYFSDIKFKYDYPIKQYVVFLGKGELEDSLKEENIDFRYNVIDMKKIDCEKFLNVDKPEALILAILCDFKEKNAKIVVSEVLEKLLKYKDYKKYVLMLEELSTLRDLRDIIKEQEMILSKRVKFEDLPSYEIGMEKGMEKEKESVVLNAYKMGLKLDEISRLVNCDIKKIKEILKKNNVEID